MTRERPERPDAGFYYSNIKRKIAFFIILALTGGAFAGSTPSFDMVRAGACKGDSIVAVQMAQEAQRRRVAVETLINETAKNSSILRVKLATVASEAIAHKYLKVENGAALENFVAGVCYQAGIDPTGLKPQ